MVKEINQDLIEIAVTLPDIIDDIKSDLESFNKMKQLVKNNIISFEEMMLLYWELRETLANEIN